MNMALILATALVVMAFFSSCANEGGPSLPLSTKPGGRPQVQDILKGKSKAEVLKIKYQKLTASCALNAVKESRGQNPIYFTDMSAGLTPPETPPEAPPAIQNPISYPSENRVIYNLKQQQIIDADLSKKISDVKISATLDGKSLKVNITFEPIAFMEQVNLNINKKRYIMKHTPVLWYSASYELLQDGLSTFGRVEGRVYEKIENQKNSITAVRLGADGDRYSFILECVIDPVINVENKDMVAEFESQWAIVDCQSPKNNAEKTVCNP